MNESKKVVIKQGKFIRFVKKGGWEYFERHHCRGIVIILAVTDDGKLLFVDQFRPPVGKRVIELPAGLVDDHKTSSGESIMTAAKRELLEETGYQAQRMVKLISGPVSGGASSDMLTMVKALKIKKVSDGGGDHLESIIVHEVPVLKAERWLKKMENKGYLIEPKIYSGLYFLGKNQKVIKGNGRR